MMKFSKAWKNRAGSSNGWEKESTPPDGHPFGGGEVPNVWKSRHPAFAKAAADKVT